MYLWVSLSGNYRLKMQKGERRGSIMLCLSSAFLSSRVCLPQHGKGAKAAPARSQFTVREPKEQHLSWLPGRSSLHQWPMATLHVFCCGSVALCNSQELSPSSSPLHTPQKCDSQPAAGDRPEHMGRHSNQCFLSFISDHFPTCG